MTDQDDALVDKDSLAMAATSRNSLQLTVNTHKTNANGKEPFHASKSSYRRWNLQHKGLTIAKADNHPMVRLKQHHHGQLTTADDWLKLMAAIEVVEKVNNQGHKVYRC